MENKTVDEMAIDIANEVSSQKIVPREWEACRKAAVELLNGGESIETATDIIESAQVFDLDASRCLDRMWAKDENEIHRCDLIDKVREILDNR